MPFVGQTNFAGGEVAPGLYGRTELDRYRNSLKRMRNFFSSRLGAAVSRPGSVYLGSVKTPADGKVRLVPFVYSDALTFVLEFGNLYVRFWSAGALVLNGGPVFEVVTPYTTAELPYLKFAQQGAVLTLTHYNHPPAELTYGGATPHDWTYAAITFDRPAMVGTPVVERYASTPASVNSQLIDVTADNSHQLKPWRWAVTEIRKDAKGNPYETGPSIVTSMRLDYYLPWNAGITYKVGTYCKSGGTQYRCILQHTNQVPPNATYWAVDATTSSPPPSQDDALDTVVVASDRAVVVRLASGYGLASVDPNFIAWRIYRGQGGLFGWIGDLKYLAGSAAKFLDDGAAPDYTRQPPQGQNPFKTFDTSGVLLSTDYPACVHFFDGRRFFARTTPRPDTFWGSVVNDYANFDTPYVGNAASRIQFAIASAKLEEIRFLTSVGPRLLLGTQSATWGVSGDGSPIAFNNIDVRRQGQVGSSWLDALVVEETALYVRTKGVGVRGVTYSWQQQSFVGVDLSVYASHLFIGYTVTDWTYAEDPWGLVLAVRSDGKLLALTHLPGESLTAWAWWDAGGGGVYESICSVPEGQEDAVYAVVQRTINAQTVRYVERFASRVITAANMNQAVCLDCAGIYSGAPATHITGLGFLEGQSVMVLADGQVDGPFTVTGGAIDLTNPDGASYVVVGLSYLPQLQQLDASIPGAEAKLLEKQLGRVGIELDSSRGLWVGASFDALNEWPQRQVSDSYGTIALTSELLKEWVRGGTDTAGAVCIEQRDPLPVTVTGIGREVALGEA